MSKVLRFFLIFFLIHSQVAFAQAPRSLTEDQYSSRITEYFYSKTGKEVLVPVKLLGELNRPGLYHVPVNTSLGTLLSISGGMKGTADKEQISVIRSDGEQKISFEKALVLDHPLVLGKSDILFIPEKTYWITQNTLNTVTVVSGILTLILTSLIVSKELERD